MVKKITYLIAILLITVISLSGVVYGESTASMKLTSAKTTISAGETVELTLSLDQTNINGGINAVTGAIDYDTDVFDAVTESNVTGTNGWASEYNTSNKKFVATGSADASNGVIKITLKAKESINTGTTTVTVKNITTADENDNDVAVANAPYTFQVSAVSPTPTPTQTPTSTPTPASTPTSTPASGNQSTSGKSSNGDSTTSNSSLPKAGKTVLSIFAVAGIIIVAVLGILYNKYRKILK